jgi:hypothetical protein
MDCRDRKGGEHGAKTSRKVHGAPDQGLNNITTIKCQNSQVSGTSSRSKGDPFGLDGSKIDSRMPTHVRKSLSNGQTMRRFIHFSEAI